jgi:vancomycin resistance protein YoaR
MRPAGPTRPVGPAPSGRPYGSSSNSRPQGPRGSAPSRLPARSGGPSRPGGSSGPGNSRHSRRTIWSQLDKGVRSLLKKIAALPRPVLIGIGVLVFFVILTMVIDSALYYNKVHAGVSVAGQSLSGKTYDQALTVLDQKAQELRTQPITLVRDTKTWTVTPEELGQVIDPDATISVAMQVTRKSNLVADLARRLALYFSDENLSLVGEVDQTKFDAFVAKIAEVLDVAPQNMKLSIQSDKIETVQGVPGYVVDQDQLRGQLMEALFAHDMTQIQVPMMAKAPDVVADSTADAETQVGTMLSADVQLTYLAPVPIPTTPTPSGEQTTATTVEQTPTTTVQQTTTTTMLKTPTGDKPFYSRTETFTPSEIKDLLDYRTEMREGTRVLVPYISAEKMRPFFSKIEGPMAVPAVDAYFYTDGVNPLIAKGVQGKGLDHDATAAALTEAALTVDKRSATAQRKDVDPEFTTEEANAMGIATLLGEHTEVYDKGTPSRVWNVRLATTKISNPFVRVTGTPTTDAWGDVWGASIEGSGNRLIAPGEEFDFAKIIGPRTKEANFLGAGGIVDGRIENDVLGGGICQVSTTLFNALLNAGVKITERWNHSIYIDHYPKGKDATITGGGEPKNLKFVNDTPNYIWLYGSSDGITTRFVLFGTSDGRKVKLDVSPEYDVEVNSESTITVLDSNLPWNSTTVAFAGQNAFKLKLTRLITWPNGSTTSETWVSQWGMKPKIVAFPTTGTATTIQP